MKRHKWNKEHWQKEGHATCVVCGTVKEKHYPFVYYFLPYDKFTAGNHAPDCDKVLHKINLLKQPAVSGSLPLFRCKCGHTSNDSLGFTVHLNCCNGNDR